MARRKGIVKGIEVIGDGFAPCTLRGLPWVVEGLPALLHISLFLFFAGLSVFLFSVNYTIFKAMIAWVALCVIVYAYLTVSLIQHKNSPYSVPLSVLVSVCFTGIRSAFFQFIERFPCLVQPFIFPIVIWQGSTSRASSLTA